MNLTSHSTKSRERNGHIQKKRLLSESYWHEDLLDSYYAECLHELTSKELDREFRKDINMLTKALSKTHEQEREAFIDIISRVIEFYIDQKIEKKINHSIMRLIDIK